MTDQELNAKIATDVMGWTQIAGRWMRPRSGQRIGGEPVMWTHEWRPATDANDRERAVKALPEDQRVRFCQLLNETHTSGEKFIPGFLWKMLTLPGRAICEALVVAAMDDRLQTIRSEP